MKKQEQLFYLIKSLSTEEKRHFKLFAKKYNPKGTNNYLLLFNAIEKQAIYDEGSIKELFKDQVFAKQLTATKYYLQKQIIKSLHFLHYDDTIERKVMAMHHQTAILFRKGQYEICSEVVEKGIEICSKNDRFLEWIGFLKWKLALSPHIKGADLQADVHAYLTNISQLIGWFEITEKGTQLNSVLNLMLMGGYSLGVSGQSFHYQDLIKRILELISIAKVEDLSAKIKYNLYYPLAHAYLAIADFDNSCKYFAALHQELEGVYNKMELFEEYVRTISGYIYALNGVGKTKVAIEIFGKLKGIHEPNERVKYLKEEILAFFPLVNSALNGDIDHGFSAIERVGKFIDNYKNSISPLTNIFANYFIAYIHLAAGNFSFALRFLRKAEQFIEKGILPEIKITVNIMQLVVYFEQEKYDLGYSRLRSLQRYAGKEPHMKDYMIVFMRYYKFLINCDPQSAQQLQVMKRFLTHLNNTDQTERFHMFLHFDIISWLQSKIDSKSFAEMLRQNHELLMGHPPESNI